MKYSLELNPLEVISSDDWSKLFTLAEYEAWCLTNPEINTKTLQKIIEAIIDRLPQNLQGVGKQLALPDHSNSYSDSEKAMADLFRKKVAHPFEKNKKALHRFEEK